MYEVLIIKFSEDAIPYAYQVPIETFHEFEHITKLSSIPQEQKTSIIRQITDHCNDLQARKLQAQIEAHMEESRLKLRMEERTTSAMNQASNLFHGLDTP